MKMIFFIFTFQIPYYLEQLKFFFHKNNFLVNELVQRYD